MRGTLRLFASVKPGRYLEPGAPTGLTGLRTLAKPRSVLLSVYHRTLDKLASIPESSVYRQSVEAVTKHRLAQVQSVKPEGYDEWAAKARDIIQGNPTAFLPVRQKIPESLTKKLSDFEDATTQRAVGYGISYIEGLSLNGKPYFLEKSVVPPGDDRYEDIFDMERYEGSDPADEDPVVVQGESSTEADKSWREAAKRAQAEAGEHTVQDMAFLAEEPVLNAEQIGELENKIGAGLIEEVIQVAEGELRLVDTMKNSQVWESLEEKPQEGQWVYFERKE